MRGQTNQQTNKPTGRQGRQGKAGGVYTKLKLAEYFISISPKHLTHFYPMYNFITKDVDQWYVRGYGAYYVEYFPRLSIQHAGTR